MNGSPTSDKPAPRRRLRALLRDRRGATAVEYGFILALIVLAMLSALQSVGNITTTMWNNISTKVVNAR